MFHFYISEIVPFVITIGREKKNSLPTNASFWAFHSKCPINIVSDFMCCMWKDLLMKPNHTKLANSSFFTIIEQNNKTIPPASHTFASKHYYFFFLFVFVCLLILILNQSVAAHETFISWNLRTQRSGKLRRRKKTEETKQKRNENTNLNEWWPKMKWCEEGAVVSFFIFGHLNLNIVV